jgi:hypothetical protein
MEVVKGREARLAIRGTSQPAGLASWRKRQHTVNIEGREGIVR